MEDKGVDRDDKTGKVYGYRQFNISSFICWLSPILYSTVKNMEEGGGSPTMTGLLGCDYTVYSAQYNAWVQTCRRYLKGKFQSVF